MKAIRNCIFGMILISIILFGCGVKLGSDTQQSVKPTLGQELIKLQEAKDSGAISEQEYVELKEKLKKSYD